jgi:hypothetical protein
MPNMIPFTRRQQIITGAGVLLQRQSVYLPADTWKALQELCTTQRRSGSVVIQSLIEIAVRGTRKDNENAHSHTTGSP